MEQAGKFMRWVIGVLVVGAILYFNYENYMYETALKREPIASRIIKIEHHNRGGNKYYHTGGWFWGVSFAMERDSAELQVGDSVYKKKYSLILQSFKKDSSGRYVKLKQFNGNF